MKAAHACSPGPGGAIDPRATAAALAVIRGAGSVQEVADAIERSKSVASMWLAMAKKEGLVAWEPFKHRTLRPLVKVVAKL